MAIKFTKFLSNYLTLGTTHLLESGEYVDTFIQASI